jgi:hypothetical protein
MAQLWRPNPDQCASTFATLTPSSTILGRGACARAGMTSKQVRDCEDSKVEPRSRSRCPEVHGASMSQRDPTALSSAFVKGPFETWLLLLLVSGLGFQPSAPKQLRDANLGPDAGGPINPVLACGVEMLSSRFGGTQLRGSRRGRRPVCPAERSSASGIVARTSSLFSDQHDAGSFSSLRSRVFSRTAKARRLGGVRAHGLTILCLLSLLPRICNPVTIP